MNEKFHRTRLGWLFLGGFLLMVGMGLRLPQVYYGLPIARSPDSVKTVDVALRLSDQWRAGSWTFDPGQYQYPTFYTNTLALYFFLTGQTNNAEAAGRFLTATAGWAAAMAAFLIGLKMGGISVAFLNMALVLFGFPFLRQGHEPNSDTLQLLLFSFSLYFLMKPPPLQRSDFFWSGLLGGLAVGTKYTALLALVPVVMTVSLSGTNRKNLFLSFRTIAVWTGAMVAGFVVATPAILTHAKDFMNRAVLEVAIQRSGGLGDISIGPWDYIFQAKNLIFHSFDSTALVKTMGPIFLMMIGLAFLWFLKTGDARRDSRWQGLWTSIFLNVVFFSLFSRIRGIRFLLCALFMMTVVLSMFYKRLAESLSSWIQKKGRSTISPGVIVCLLGFITLAHPLFLTSNYLSALSKPDSRILASLWINQHVPPGSKILNLMMGPALPKDRFDLETWNFPEYYSDLIKDLGQPSYQELVQKGFSCVVLNSFYLKKFDQAIPESDSAFPYFERWRIFRRDLQAKAVQKEIIASPSVLSPQIEIFIIPAEH